MNPLYRPDHTGPDLEIVRGTVFGVVISFRDGNGRPVDLTGFTMARFTVRDRQDNVVLALNDSVGVAITPEKVTIFAAEDDTEDTAADDTGALEYWGRYDFILYDAGGSDPRQLLRGRMRIRNSVTELP